MKLNLELLGRAASNLETQAQDHMERASLTKRPTEHARQWDQYRRFHGLAAQLWEIISEVDRDKRHVG